jgi:hypothetical protein
MNWEQCKNFGLIQIDPTNNTIRLYYSPYCHTLAGSPNFLTIENAIWQGDNLLVRGTDNYGNSLVYVMNGFNSYRRIV